MRGILINEKHCHTRFDGVGEGNSYGHPKTEVVNRLLSHGCSIYTTMDNGNIVFTCDGENFRIYTDQQTGDFRQDTEEAA